MGRQHIKFLVLFSLILYSCGIQKPSAMAEQNSIDFCSLPNYLNKEVRLKASYSGIDEYWSLNPLNKKRCSADIKLELDFDDKYKLPEKFLKQMKTVHENYWNTYLIIDAIGIYETKEKGGYGHLGHNNSRFKIIEILNIELKRKKIKPNS